MNKLAATALTTAAVAVVVLNGGSAMASGGSPSGAWPADLPLPTNPGTVVSQTSIRATVRSTQNVGTVRARLDQLYVTQKGCTLRLVVNKPKDYFCYNPATRKTDEIYFTFASLDPTPTDPTISQTNAFLVRG